MAPERGWRRRRNMFAETRLLMEYLAEHYAGRTWHVPFRVGADPAAVGVEILDEAELRLIRNTNRRVDAVVEPPPDLVMIEATMYRPTEKIGRLQEYLLLLEATPEAEKWKGAPLVPILLTGQDDPVARVLAERAGLTYVFWEPPWISDFYAEYPQRRRRASHAGMAAELARRFEGTQERIRAGRELASDGGERPT